MRLLARHVRRVRRISLPHVAAARLRSIAAAAPTEVCGGLYGHVSGHEGMIVAVFQATNSAAAARLQFRLSLDELQQEGVRLRRVLPAADGLVAVFHSHPMGPVEPSPLDLRAMQVYPIPWLICTGGEKPDTDPSLRCFAWRMMSLDEIAIRSEPAEAIHL